MKKCNVFTLFTAAVLLLSLFWGGCNQADLSQPEVENSGMKAETNEDQTRGTGRPKVWIFTDMSDSSIKRGDGEPVNDPDDISAMAGYLLMYNEFETLGIVVASTHRSELKNSPDQAAWARSFFGSAYTADLPGLNNSMGGYPGSVDFIESSIKKTSHRFNDSNSYSDLSNFQSVKALLSAVQSQGDVVNVLCWGSLTEPAIFVKHCISTGKGGVLQKVRFIAHWTNSTLHQGTPSNPGKVANCNEDSSACSYLKARAKNSEIKYYELGAIGQHGIVSGAYTGTDYFNQFKTSKLGKIFAEGKYVYSKVDHSDSATYWTLLGDWGVSLSDVNSDGTNPQSIEMANEAAYRRSSKDIHDELLRRAKASAEPEPTTTPIPTVAPTSTPSPTATPGSGYIYIVNKATGHKIRSYLSEAGVIVQVPADNMGDWVQWEVVGTSGEYFRLKYKPKSTYLSMTDSADHSKVTVSNNTTPNEEWRKVDMGDGYFLLENRATGKRIRSRSTDNLSDNPGGNFYVEVSPLAWTGNWVRWQFVEVE